MPELHDLLERRGSGYGPPADLFERVHDRRRRRDRNRRIGTAVVALVVAGVAIGGLLRMISSGSVPAADARDPFLGTWVSTSDADGGTQTMTVSVFADGGVEIVVLDDVATVCSGTPSTMTGTGRIEAGTRLVIPAPVYMCDDGSEPEALSGPPLEEQLRDWTLFLDPQTDTLSDGVGGVWLRPGAPELNLGPTISDSAWPQSSLKEVREAQELADAGDPRFTWQVDPELAAEANVWDAEIVARFLREELGWEEFVFNPFVGYEESFSNLTYIRCAPGGTNSLYPLHPDDLLAGGCAPTIDELRYETVSLDLSQPGVRGRSGIWVVSRWAMVEPFAQVAPPTAQATVLMEDFLQARIDGEGAEEFLLDGEFPPLLYATTSGAPYERSELERVGDPQWPFGAMEFKARLFAKGGKTVVEELYFVNTEGGRLGLEYRPSGTFENGQPLPLPYSFLDGEVTFAAAHPWDYNIGGDTPTMHILIFEDPDQLAGFDQRFAVVADPLPVESGCRQGPAPADAEALARSIRSDPDLEATESVAASVGGIEALQMDVVLALGASVCDDHGLPQVLTPNDQDWAGVALEHGQRMRLYLLDLPEGMSARTFAIAISAPEADFERVLEAAAPILESFEFHAE